MGALEDEHGYEFYMTSDDVWHEGEPEEVFRFVLDESLWG